MMKGKVLFLFPNTEGYAGIPNGLALLSGCLRDAGFDTKCFDTTFMKSHPKSHMMRQKHGGTEKMVSKKPWEYLPITDEAIFELFKIMVKRYKPDLIAVSFLDVFYVFGVKLLAEMKEYFDVPVVAGGITATLSPELVFENSCIDIVCIGEGEEPLVELMDCIVEKKDYTGIKNLWVKKDGRVFKNCLRPLKDITKLSFQDWSIFDEKHLYKAFCGRYHRNGMFETARGCPYNCPYCVTGNLRRLYKGLGSFIRYRDVDDVVDEIISIWDKYNLELVFFIDDNFLGMPRDRFFYFCEQYEQRVGLPFYIQSRCETINEEYVKCLKKAGVVTVSIGVEHGNEFFRNRFLNRNILNSDLIRAFGIVKKYGIRTTANLMIGLPFETEKFAMDTIRFIKKLCPDSYSISFFQPFRGTRMREWAVDIGSIPSDHVITDSNLPLDLPDFSRERIIYCYENFGKILEEIE